MDIVSTDVAIIGGGVAGLYSVYCCNTVGLPNILFEALPYVGGQCMAFYPDKPIYGVPGLPEVLAKDFIANLFNQCKPQQMYLNTCVTVTKHDNAFLLSTNNNKWFLARYLIIASGIGIMEPSLPIGIKGAIELANTTDFVQCYCLTPELYKNRNVVIAGGGNSAADYALCISKVAKRVTLLHKRAQLRCDKSKLDKLNKNEFNNIQLKLEQEIQELQLGIVITNEERIEADKIVFCYGLHINPNSINNISALHLKMEQNLIKCNLATMKTSENRCYAVGDVVSYPGKKKGILSCCYEAQLAVHNISLERDN